jgi:hypothetical protein
VMLDELRNPTSATAPSGEKSANRTLLDFET